jgi:hypothetical protein
VEHYGVEARACAPLKECTEIAGLVAPSRRGGPSGGDLLEGGQHAQELPLLGRRQAVEEPFLDTVQDGFELLGISDETTEFGYFAPDALPADTVVTHLERIADAVAVRGGAAFVVR